MGSCAATYEVEPALIGRRVELVFDPFDLANIAVRYTGRDMGIAIPHHLGRHVHPAATPTHQTQPAPATGIDYLSLARDHHDDTVTTKGSAGNTGGALPSAQHIPIDHDAHVVTRRDRQHVMRRCPVGADRPIVSQRYAWLPPPAAV